MTVHNTVSNADQRQGTTAHDDGAVPSDRPGPPPRRAPALPSGRALVGGLLVTGAAVAAFLVASRGPEAPDTHYVVAARSIEAGAALTTSDLEVVALELDPRLAALTTPSREASAGAVALRDLHPGELVLTHDLIEPLGIGEEPAPVVHELTIPVPLDRSPSRLVRGDRVTVLATSGPAGEEGTVVAAEDATVLEFSRGDALGARSAALTLALDHAQLVIDVADLTRDGTVTVVRTTRALDDTYPARPTEEVSP